MRLQEELAEEKDHSAFLEGLLMELYGDGWEKLTMYEARKWHERHFPNQSLKPTARDDVG